MYDDKEQDLINMSCNRSELDWLSVYFWNPSSWERFLTVAIKPFIERLYEDKLISQFFFIRYWENGPHIRLRIKAEREILSTEIKSFLLAYFEPLVKIANVKNTSPLKTMDVTIDSIGFYQYEPEFMRYGGRKGISIAEKQFEASSRAVLAILADSKKWDYSVALGKAIQLHLAFACALEFSDDDTLALFDSVFRIWNNTAALILKQSSNLDAIQIKDKTETAFSSSFNKQKDFLIPFFKDTWSLLRAGKKFEEKWFNDWYYDMTGIRSSLASSLDTSDLLELSKTLNQETPTPQHGFYFILDSYIHMTNNRLGIFNHDEGYLAYLIRECLLTTLKTKNHSRT